MVLMGKIDSNKKRKFMIKKWERERQVFAEIRNNDSAMIWQ